MPDKQEIFGVGGDIQHFVSLKDQLSSTEAISPK
jgi:hypothetical protein